MDVRHSLVRRKIRKVPDFIKQVFAIKRVYDLAHSFWVHSQARDDVVLDTTVNCQEEITSE